MIGDFRGASAPRYAGVPCGAGRLLIFSRMVYTRKFLNWLAERGRIDAAGYQEALEGRVYTTLPGWQRVLRTGLLALGLGLVASAVLFLLAFNWEVLTVTQQLGIAGLSVAVPVLLSLTPLFALPTRKMLLTLGAFMVGGLFAVFGQIYQTGANSYDFFLAWLLFITVWTVVVDFAALWVVWLLVLNLTLFFYGDQQIEHWRTYEMLGLQTMATGVALVGFTLYSKHRTPPYPSWFLNLIAIGVAILGVAAAWMTAGSGDDGAWVYIVRGGSLVTFAVALYAGYRMRWLGLLSVMSLGLIAVIAGLIVMTTDLAGGFFLASIIVLGGTTGATIVINTLRKEWTSSEEEENGEAAGAIEETEEQRLVDTDTALEPPVVDLANPLTIPAIQVDDYAAYQAHQGEQPSVGIQLLTIFGGLLSVVTLLGLLALMGVFDERGGQLITGLLLLGGGLLLDRSSHSEFLGSVLVGAVTSGAVLLMLVLFDWRSTDWALVCGLGMAINLLVLLVATDKLLQLLATVGIHAAVLFYGVEWQWGWFLQLYLAGVTVFVTYWTLAESELTTASPYLAKRYGPIRTGSLVVYLMAGCVYTWYRQDYYSLYPTWNAAYIVIVPILLVLTYRTIKDLQTDTWPPAAYVAGLFLLLLPLYLAPATTPALFIFVLCTKINYRLGMSLAAAAFIYCLGQYYYDLRLNLFEKAVVMAGAGVAVLLAYAAVRHKLQPRETSR